jgi:hypothetical protein
MPTYSRSYALCPEISEVLAQAGSLGNLTAAYGSTDNFDVGYDSQIPIKSGSIALCR